MTASVNPHHSRSPGLKSAIPDWKKAAREHATDYLHRFAFNPAIAQIVKEFDSHFANIKNFDYRLDYLKKIAAEHWDYRKGRERYQVTETYPLDDPGSVVGRRIYASSCMAEMGSSSRATLKHYSIMAILGGANKSPYYRLRYALEQHVSYGMLAYLGSQREVEPPEQELTKDYARGARTEFDLGLGAIVSLMKDQLDDAGEYKLVTSEWQIARLQQKDATPIFLLSAPPFLGGKRANTADTYDFMRRLEQEAFNPTKNILFATGAIFRYAQYFDAMREICLLTGVDIEVIGYEPAYGGMDFKPTQFLQELKSAADAAVRLRDAVRGKEEKFLWRNNYYNRFERDEASKPA